MRRISLRNFAIVLPLCTAVTILAGCDNSPKVQAADNSAEAAAGTLSAATPSADATVTLPPPPPEPSDADLLDQTAKRVAALVQVRNALEKYATDHGGGYPVSNGDAQGYHSQWGASLGANWIPELVPKYISELPRDPAGALFSNGPMYLYMSDGKRYKLIAHGVPKCSSSKLSDGVAIDPVRSAGADGCWAFGVWSTGGEKL